MVKKTGKKQRGVQKGVPKHSIRSHESVDLFSLLLHSVLSPNKKKYLKYLAQACWFSTVKVCTKLALVPLTLNSERKFVQASGRRRLLHYFLMALMPAVAGHQILVTIQMASSHGLVLETYLCAAYAIVVCLGICTSFGTSVQFSESAQLLNSIPSMLRSLDDIVEKKVDPFDRPLFCVRVIAATWIVYVAALNTSFYSLIFDSLPVCIYTIIQRNDLIPDIGVPSIAWCLLFYPFELMALMPPMWITGLNLNICVIAFEQFPIYVEQLRNVQPRSIPRWEKVNRLFNCLRIYNIMCNNFTKLFVPPALFAICSAVIILLYVTIRPSGLPLFVYCWFPLVAAVTMSVVSWLIYDVVNAKRGSEELQANHQNRMSPFFKSLPPLKKRELLLRARTLRPVVITAGEFSEISFEVLMNMWDEIINQLVFLLTL